MRKIRRDEQGIRLKGVNRSVTGRTSVGPRVHYAMARGGGGIVEKVILERARAAGYRGFRLSPYVWRVLPHLIDDQPLANLRVALDDRDLASLARLRKKRKLITALLAHIPLRQLVALVTRHVDPSFDGRRPGVPDLLILKDVGAGHVAVRFVEVKRPKEALKAHQRTEIAFMRSLGMRAGVLRVRER
jgi:hypothetical protein